MVAHITRAIAEQLRLRCVDVLAATEEGTNQLPDDELLETASTLGRVIFTHDIRFRSLADRWQREGRANRRKPPPRQQGGGFPKTKVASAIPQGIFLRTESRLHPWRSSAPGWCGSRKDSK